MIAEFKAYIAQYNEEDQKLLQEMYDIIHEVASECSEKIAYGMPCFFYSKNVVYFANAKHHIGFYPTPSAIAVFAKQLEPYKTSKGAIQFPKNKKLPKKLIQEITQFRLQEVKD